MTDDLVKRLRGEYRIPITDGLGAVGAGDDPDSPHEFVRHFKTPPIQHEAADRIEELETALKFYTKANPDFLQTADWIWDCGEKRYGYVAREALQGVKDER